MARVNDDSGAQPTAHPPPSVVSQDELRKKLYQTFKERGVLDTLKKQLRQQMIQELMQPVLRGDVHPQSIPVEGSALLVEASNILVADHLQRCGYEYSLSVFYPESGLTREKMFTMEDLLQLVQITPQSSIYKALISRFDRQNPKGFLMQFLKELTEYYQPKMIRDVETQTSSLPDRDSLAAKLQLIDDQFAEACIPRPKLESLEMKLNEYKREIEQQLRIEMCEKLKYLKDTEIAKVKLEERRKSEKELAEFRKEFELACQVKSEKLLSQERETVERIQKLREIELKELFAERQILLKDMSSLREREEELKQKMNAFDLAQKVKEEENKSMAESLRKREQDLKNAEEIYEGKLSNEILKCKLELEDDYISKCKKLIEDEKRNKEKTVHLEGELSALKSKLEELKHSEHRAKELELELESAKVQMLALTEQNQTLSAKVKEKNSALAEGNAALQAQNRLLQQQLHESRNENSRLRNRLAKASTEVGVYRKEQRKPDGFNPSLSVQNHLDSHQQALHKKLQSEMENSAQLKAKLLDYDSSVKRLTAQVSNLKLQLRQTQTALENEMYHNPKPSAAEGSTSADKLMGRILPLAPDTSGDVSRPSLEQDRPPEPVVKTAQGDQHASPDSDLEFVASTKARVRELEQEAEQLEKTFQEYNLRVSQQLPDSQPDESCLLSQQLLRNAPSLTARSHRGCILPESGLGPEAPLLTLHGGPRSEMAVPASGRPSRRKSIASRRLSSLSPKAKRSLDNELYLEGDGKSVSKTTDPCQDSVSQHLSAEAKCSSPSRLSHHSTLSPNASLFQRPNGDDDNTEFANLDNPDFLDKEEFESLEYERHLPCPFEPDGFYPAGDMPHMDSTTVAIRPAGDMRHMDSAAAAIPFQYPSAEQKPTGEQLQEEKLWEQQMKERRLREEKRHSERQEALEKERRELERLEQERKMIEKSLNLDQEKDTEPSVKERKEESIGGAGPLEKYMKIIQQEQPHEAEEKSQDEKKKAKEGSEIDTSPTSDPEESFTGFSQEEMDDFW